MSIWYIEIAKKLGGGRKSLCIYKNKVYQLIFFEYFFSYSLFTFKRNTYFCIAIGKE